MKDINKTYISKIKHILILVVFINCFSATAQKKEEYPLYPLQINGVFDKLGQERKLEGTYYSIECDIKITIKRNLIDDDYCFYTYKFKSSQRNLEGEVPITRDSGKKVNLYITLLNIEYAEDFLDVPAPTKERQKLYDKLKERRKGKRKTGISALVESNTIIIQNKGKRDEGDLHFIKLSDCDKQYIYLKKQ